MLQVVTKLVSCHEGLLVGNPEHNLEEKINAEN